MMTEPARPAHDTAHSLDPSAGAATISQTGGSPPEHACHTQIPVALVVTPQTPRLTSVMCVP